MSARFAAHPLVVAAAFGLLGPAALAQDEETDEILPLAPEPAPAYDEAEFARVEAEWFKVRGLRID